MRLKLLSSLFVIAACGDGGGPRPQEVSPGEVQGNWALQLTDTAGCAGPNFEHAIIAASLFLEPSTLFLRIDGNLSRWSSSDLSGWVEGWLPLYVNGMALLNLRSGPLANFQFIGGLSDQLTLRGTLTDSVPLLSPNPCIYRARGSRVP
jgi:hypothetical protein